MPKFTKKAEYVKGGTVEVETSHPREIADLKAQGFTEAKASKPAESKPASK